MEWYGVFSLIFLACFMLGIGMALPVNPIPYQMISAIAADGDFGPTTGNKIALIMAPFAFAPTTVLADLVLANFTGSTPIVCKTGTPAIGQDPNTGEWIMNIEPATGTFYWSVGDATNIPQTIYGYCVMDHTATALIAIEQFPTPITLTLPTQFIDLGAVQFRMVSQPLS